MTNTEIPKTEGYLDKLKGAKLTSGIAYPNWTEILISGVGGLLILAILNYLSLETDLINAFIVPFGATAVLVFAAPAAPFSQPRNVVGGHLISGLVGIIIITIFKESAWWTMALSTSIAIMLMVATKTVHPPAGATALLPVVNGITSFSWLVTPVLAGCLLFVLVGVLYNNLWAKRKYPAFWA